MSPWDDDDLASRREWDDAEEPDDPDEFDDESVETEPCPACGKPIYEDADVCPCCGAAVVFSSSPLAGRPAWFIVLGLMGILAAVLAMIRFF